ncbi:hypothetical protein [Dactylosporangium sp. NPDC000521]
MYNEGNQIAKTVEDAPMVPAGSGMLAGGRILEWGRFDLLS